MSDSTRRGFLAMTGAGAAAVGAATVVPNAFAGSRNDTVDQQTADASAVDGPLVAYVNDLRTGEVSVMVGDHEVTVVDKDLVARIARISGAEA